MVGYVSAESVVFASDAVLPSVGGISYSRGSETLLYWPAYGVTCREGMMWEVSFSLMTSSVP